MQTTLFYRWCAGAALMCLIVFSGCALNMTGAEKKLGINEAEQMSLAADRPDTDFIVLNVAEGSLWRPQHSRAYLFGDNRASNINDIVTVQIFEQSDASRDATTKLSKKGEMSSGISKFFGAPLDFGLGNLWGKNTGAATAALRTDRPFKPELETNSENSYDGSGSTTRKDRLVATLSAKVIDVYPNGNLHIAGKREVTVNNEKQIIQLTGTIRPEDISPNNVVLSTTIADAQISLVGRGVIADKQDPGAGHRMFDFLWPF